MYSQHFVNVRITLSESQDSTVRRSKWVQWKISSTIRQNNTFPHTDTRSSQERPEELVPVSKLPLVTMDKCPTTKLRLYYFKACFHLNGHIHIKKACTESPNKSAQKTNKQKIFHKFDNFAPKYVLKRFFFPLWGRLLLHNIISSFTAHLWNLWSSKSSWANVIQQK